MNEINIFGFPKTMKRSKIFQILKSAVFGKRLRSRFWIQDVVPAPDSNFVIVIMYFNKQSDAAKAIELLNNFVYYNRENKLHFSAVNVTSSTILDNYDDCIDNNINQAKRDRESRQTNKPQLSPATDNGRSRSPHKATNITDIDMEIELVRKKRFLIIEQRKLILEKKRLELLREFEPSSLNELEMYAAAVEKYSTDNELPTTPQVPNRPKVKGTSIPVKASGAIFKAMNDALLKRYKVRGIKKALYFALNRRFNELLQGKGQVELDDVLRLYREVYPVDTDKALMDQIQAQIIQNNQALEKISTGTVKDTNELERKALPDRTNSVNVKDEVKIVNNEESKKKESANKEIIDAAIFSDTELDDWLDLSAPEKDDQQDVMKEDENIVEVISDDGNKDTIDNLQQEVDGLEKSEV